jgi:hypothetical protein
MNPGSLNADLNSNIFERAQRSSPINRGAGFFISTMNYYKLIIIPNYITI